MKMDMCTSFLLVHYVINQVLLVFTLHASSLMTDLYQILAFQTYAVIIVEFLQMLTGVCSKIVEL